MNLNIEVFNDGDNEPIGLREIIQQWKDTWEENYADSANLIFDGNFNFKNGDVVSTLQPKVKQIVEIRNPDIFFIEKSLGIPLGGVEITVHSPDGSNVEKRYPYLWASKRSGIDAFIACPYSKRRPLGMVNKLPYRHANRNLQFSESWDPSDDGKSILCQIIPTIGLQTDWDGIPDDVSSNMFTWSDFGNFFAHSLAKRILRGKVNRVAKVKLGEIKAKLSSLITACLNNTSHTEPSTLLKLPEKWIQVYNIRPDVGHWERGEGQFDSIDGRLMFTLDEMSFLSLKDKPESFEFWLPQLASRHPWVTEQMARNYGSKRFRNIMVVLSDLCKTKFSNDLSEADWEILKKNSSMLLERLDWQPGIFKVKEVADRNKKLDVARIGLKGSQKLLIEQISRLLDDDHLFFSSHRAYLPNWKEELQSELSKLPSKSTVLIPRIPGNLLQGMNVSGQHIVCAEDCTRAQLMMLRQLHRTSK